MTDQQKEFVEKDFIRHYLLSIVPDAHGSAMWTNQMQEAAEAAPSACRQYQYRSQTRVHSDR